MRWYEITESVNDNFLYHGTDASVAEMILTDDIMKGMTEHRAERLGYPTDYWENGKPKYKYIYGISLTRSPMVASRFGTSGVVFVLDAIKIRQSYKVKPVDYYANFPTRPEWHRTEQEEFVITQKGLEPIGRFIVEIRITQKAYNDCMRNEDEYSQLLHHPKLKIV